MCRTRPSSDRGRSQGVAASCPAWSPSHFSCSVSRWQRRNSLSVARSSPNRVPPFARVTARIDEHVRPVLRRHHADRDYWRACATGLHASFRLPKPPGCQPGRGVGPPCQPCKWLRTDHQFGRNLDRHADPRLPGHNGGYRVGRQAQVRHCAWPDLLPFTRLSKLFVPGTSLRKPASCQWICR
jgi:hypothetical protein